MQKDYLERVYAGFLGMNIGIRLGAPVEPTIWTYERIRDTYGDITDYVKEYKNFAADDDVNGPVYFFRALRDDAEDRELKPQDVANAWLNYAREGVGMFWWGGYGISTEHTAYLNLKNGIPAPQSGSARQNGKILAEQIGGQIFIDTWGLCWPGNPEMAAQYGEAAASVSHDGEGIYGARFFCACIAEAFVSDEETSDTREVVNAETASADETAVEAPEAEETERELPEDGVIAGECDICAPWDGHDIIFVRDTLVGLGCKKVERMNPAKKLYRIVFARESNVNTREECISRGYAVEKFPATARGGVSERTLNKMWDGDSGSFDRSAMAAKRVSSIARCVHDGHKEYEVTFMTPSGKERKCILDYSSLRMLGLIV